MSKEFLINNNVLQRYRGEEKVVQIPDGVLMIGKSAFATNKTITEVIMPDSVIELGEGAFRECAKLRKVTVSKNLEIINESVFYKCRALKSLELPSSVKKIGYKAFAGCSKLELCTCESEDIEFTGNPFEGMVSDGTCKMLYDKDGLLIFAGILFCYEGNSSELIIPNHVKRIYPGVFRSFSWEENHLKKVVIPDSVVEIGRNAFEGCEMLKEVVVSDHVIMGESVFEGCKKLVDKDDFVILNGTLYGYFGNREELVIPEGVTKIARRVFTTGYGSNPGNKTIKKVTFPKSLITIGGSAFENCKSLEYISISENLKSIGENAFLGCTSLRATNLPESVNEIGQKAFSGCKEFANEQGFVIVNNVLYDYFGNERELVIPEGVVEISADVFSKRMLEKIQLPSTLRTLGSAFDGCDRLEEITIPEGISRIASYTFSGCTNLKMVHLPSNLKEIGKYAFAKCRNLQEISIPETVVSIEAYVFSECEALETVKFPSNIDTLERGVFQNCKKLKEVCLPEHLQKIDSIAFEGCMSLESIKIPETVLFIGQGAFQNCASLREFEYPEIKGTVSLDAFDGCNALADKDGFVVIANILWKYIGEGGDVVVPEGVTALAENVFREGNLWSRHARTYYRTVGSLTSLTLPKTIKEIHKNAIRGCRSLKTLIFPEGVEVIGEEALSECLNLETVVLPNTLKRIENKAFFNCNMLSKIEIPASVEMIAEEAFRDCMALSAIHVSEDNTKYSSKDGILYNKEGNIILFCPGGKNLLRYTIPDDVVTIASYAFINCVTLQSVTIPASVQRIESQSFPKYNWPQKNVLDDIEVAVKAGAKYIGTDIFTFSYGEGALVYPKLPVTFVKEQSNQLRLALGYCLHPEQYEGEWEKGYEAYVKSHQKSLLKLATSQCLMDAVAYLQKLEEDSAKGKVKKINYKKLSESQKVDLLESSIIEGELSKIKEVLENCQTFEFTARALGLACLFGNLEIVKLLVEHGATFTYESTTAFQKKYGVSYNSTYSSYPADYSLMLVRNGVNAYVPSVYVPAYTIHFAYMPNFVFDETKENQRADIAEYLTQNAEKVGFNPMYVLYYAILWGFRPVVDRLLALGVKLSAWVATVVADTTLSVDRNEWLGTLQVLSVEQTLYTLKTIHKCLEGTEYKIIFSQTNFENMQEKFSDSEFLQFVLEQTDISKLTKSKVMEFIVETEHIAGLEWIAKEEWIKKPAQRDKLIQFAMEHQKNDALAWLMDYKNKTADLVAEAEKEEAKMMRELMANPNSVTALKKIWGYKKLEDDTLIITSYKGSDLEVEVPAKIGKNQVSVIGEWAFSEVADRIKNAEVRKKITSVVLPEGITEIQYGAFVGCEGLTHINLPSTLKKIGKIAFRRCKLLEPMDFPKKIKEIGENAFGDCAKLYDENGFLILAGRVCDLKNKEIHMNIPEGPTQVLTSNWHLNMASITLPESMEIIGQGVFKNLHQLIRVDMGEHIHTIGEEAFCSCLNLKEIVLPKSLKKIGKQAFAGSGLRELRIPEGVEKIGPQAFAYCRGLVDIYIPASVKTIGQEIFSVGTKGIYVHTPAGSYAETYLKTYVGVNVVNDEMQ